MEIREFAEQVLLSDSLEKKLGTPEAELTDHQPGPAVRHAEPVRPLNLQFGAPRAAPAMPKSMVETHRRGIAHHIMANHELQALEVMAWTLLAFPEAPQEFRTGMVTVMLDEQRHTRMHVERAAKLGIQFGDFPVNCYIWKKAMDFESPLEYLAGLPLVFEGCNLDHSLEFAELFLEAGDERSAALMKVIHRDEIEHVRFGIEWLRKMKPEHLTDFEAFEKNLRYPLRPSKARGTVFQRDARLQAGLSPDFIDAIEQTDEKK